MSRFREGRHAEVQAGEGDLDQMEDDMRNLGAYRMSGNAKSLIEPDRTPRKMYGDFPAIPETPRDYAKRPEKPTTKKYVASSPRQNRAIGLGQGRKSERPLTRLEKEQEYAAVKLQSMARGRAQRSQLLQEKALEQQMANQDNDNDDNDDIQKNRPSLRDRRRSKSREKAQSRGSTGSLPRVSQPESFEMENNQQNNVRGRSQSEMQPRSPTSDSRQRRSPSPRKARATQGSYNTTKGRGSPSSVASEYTDRGLNIDFDAVEQLRLKLKQACTTHKGCEPSKMFDRWDRDKDGELDRDEVHDGLKKLLGKDVLREWNMFENFFAYIDTDGNNSIDRDEFAEFVTTKPEVQVIRRKSQQYDSPKQVFENFSGTFQGDKHRGGQKAFGAHGDVDKRPKSYYKERTGIDSSPTQLKTKGNGSNSPTTSIDISEIDFDAVEQLRLKLKISCTTHKGCEPSKIFDKWDKDKDGELDRDEVLDGMNKLLGKDVLSEWNMFENFFAYIDTDGNNSIDRDEFAEFVTAKPEVQTIRRKSQQYDSPKQVFENFHGTFQGDKHKGGQKAFGSYGDTDKKQKSYYIERTGLEPAEIKAKKKQLDKSLNADDIDFDAVEQLRLKLKQACNTHKGLEPSKIFDKWDKDKDGELDRDEVLEGMNKLLGKDVLEEWNMFENFFAYIDSDGNNSIDRDEFAEFVTFQPEVKVVRRKTEIAESPKQVFESFHGTFQGDKHKGGQKQFGRVGGDAWEFKKTYGGEYDD